MNLLSFKNSEIASEMIQLLMQLISEPSPSGKEQKTADLLENFLIAHGASAKRKKNNIWSVNDDYSPDKPSLLLNSQHDTGNPNDSWTRDPFLPAIEGGRLYGLGSNDAGASLVSLLAAFLHFHSKTGLKYNLIFAATGEEENTGPEGIDSILNELGEIDLAIVGEPTGMQMASAEKGLIVLRCRAHGTAGHAARDTGDNAIFKAIKDIQWFDTYRFPKVSERLGPVKMSVTQIQAGSLHNVIPDQCDFTVDIRTTNVYSHEEIMAVIEKNTASEILSSSLRLHPSSIPEQHALVSIADDLNIKTFGSPTLSDQARIPAPSVKIGPGISERSHTADEFVYLSEIEEGIQVYIKILERLLLS